MFTDKIVKAIPTNAKFYNILFSLMKSSIPCNLIVASTLSETLKMRIDHKKGEAAAYFLTPTDFYYADAQTKQPIRIEMNAEQFTKIKKEFSSLKGITSLEENHFKKINELTGHQHYDEKAKEKLFELYQVLLNRSRLYEDRHDRHNGISEFSITLKKLLIAEHLNIIFELICNQLLITPPVAHNISPLYEDNNANVISAHGKRIETYLNTEALLTDRSKKITSAATLTSEYSKEIDDFFIKKVDDALGSSLPKYELKAQVEKIIVNSQERMARTFIKRSVHFIKPDYSKIYHGILPGTSTAAYFQEIETESNASTNNDKTLIALGTTRNAVSNILVTYDFDDDIRREFVAEIRKVLMEGNNPHLKQLYKNNTWEDLKNEWDKDNNNIIINQRIDQYCMKMGVYRDYIMLGIGKDLPLSMAVIKFFSKHKNLDLYLWEKKENDQKAIVLKEHFPGAAEIETVHLFRNRDLTHVSVLVPREHKKSEYLKTLDMLAKTNDAFHQKHSGFGEPGAMTYIADTLSHLKKDMHLHIENARSYSQLYAYLFHSLNNAAQLGHALINRAPIIINQSSEEYIIDDRNKLCAHIKAWGFKTFSLSEVEEPKTQAEREEIERAISDLIQFIINEPKIILKLELPKWFADKFENEAQVLRVQEGNANLEAQDTKNLALVAYLEEKRKSSAEEDSSFDFFKKTFTKIVNKESYKKEKLLEARTNLLMLLGLVYATDKEERMEQVAAFKQSDVEQYFCNLALIVCPDKNNAFKSEQETDKSHNDRCAQLFGDAAPQIKQRIECYVQYFGDQAFNQIKEYKELCVKTYKSEEVTLTEVDNIVEQSEQLCEDYVTRANMEREKAEARAKELHKRRKEVEARLEQARKETEEARAEREIACAEKEKLQAENAAFKKKIAIGNFHMALQNFDINLKRITADGNCQFSAAREAYLLVNNNLAGDNAATLRAKVVAYIREHSERFKSFLAKDTQAGHEHQDIAYSSIEEYVNNLEKEGTYGDHLSLQALAEIMQRPIVVLQPSGDILKPVQLGVVRPGENVRVDINQALILIFNGRDHYETTKTRGNAEFIQAICKTLPEYQTAAAIKVQTFFRDYQVRKNRKNEAPAPNQTIDVSALRAEFN